MRVTPPLSESVGGAVYIANQLTTDKATIIEIEVSIPARGKKGQIITLPLFVGTSTRHPDDPYDAQIGYELALGRALRQAGRKLIHDGNNKSRQAGRGRRLQAAKKTQQIEVTPVGEAVRRLLAGQTVTADDVIKAKLKEAKKATAKKKSSGKKNKKKSSGKKK